MNCWGTFSRSIKPAYIAACNGHVDTLRLLYELGADLDTPANDGATPAHVSAHQGHVEVSGFLAENVAQRFLEMNC